MVGPARFMLRSAALGALGALGAGVAYKTGGRAGVLTAAAGVATWWACRPRGCARTAPPVVAVVDCGSGHTSLTFYSSATSRTDPDTPGALAAPLGMLELGRVWVKHVDGGNLPLADVIPGAKGGAFRGDTLEDRTSEFIVALQDILDHPVCSRTKSPLILPTLDILYIGATGGVREAVLQGRLTQAQISTMQEAFRCGFGGRVPDVRFALLSGAEEARWELVSAQAIWGGKAAVMFPDCKEGQVPPAIGLFSGGGKSMQLASTELGNLSFPFSTFPFELEERQGAAPDAWLDDAKWGRFEAELRSKIEAQVPNHARFEGCYVGTAMNHRAAMYAGIAERPITAAAAAAALRRQLPMLRARTGELYEKMMASQRSGSTYPLARITAMHTFRLATVLDLMFAPHAQLYFARNGADAAGNPVDCEWTVGAFAEMAELWQGRHASELEAQEHLVLNA